MAYTKEEYEKLQPIVMEVAKDDEPLQMVLMSIIGLNKTAAEEVHRQIKEAERDGQDDDYINALKSTYLTMVAMAEGMLIAAVCLKKEMPVELVTQHPAYNVSSISKAMLLKLGRLEGEVAVAADMEIKSMLAAFMHGDPDSRAVN